MSSAPALSESPVDLPANAFALKRTNQLAGLLTIIRDRRTQRGDFIFYSDRVIRLLCEEGPYCSAAAYLVPAC